MAMKCPACPNQLSTVHVGALKVDACQGGCGGIWFDAFELKRVDDENEAAGEPLMHLKRDPRVQVDFARKRDCPRCADIRLKRHLFSPQSRVEVDECPNCGGYWLDDGELAKIRTERAHAARAEQHAESESAISIELIRYMYQVRTGHKKPRPL
jgi:Zn-finger nucleic acid-binding protein